MKEKKTALSKNLPRDKINWGLKLKKEGQRYSHAAEHEHPQPPTTAKDVCVPIPRSASVLGYTKGSYGHSSVDLK